MKKTFKTLEEQIILLKSRGLVITDEELAKTYLLSSNYYNIINGYGRYFPKDYENFTAQTEFNEIARLYLFDKEIKQILFRALLSIESHLKSIFAYRFAEAFPNKEYAYLNISCYDPKETLSVIDTISKLTKTIKKHKKYAPNSISHYIEKYGDVPIWVLSNYLNFGELRYMLKASQLPIRNKVASDMRSFIEQHDINRNDTFPPETMMSFLGGINFLRNACAHNNKLIEFCYTSDIKYWKSLHSKYDISPQSERRDVYNIFLVMQCFLSKFEYGFLHNSIRKAMHSHLENQIHSLPVNAILKHLGFPNDWHTFPKLPQS